MQIMKFNKNDYPNSNEHFHQRLCEVLDSLPEGKESKTMKMSKTGKVALIAASLTVIIGASAFAGSGIVSYWTGSSNSGYDYKDIPSQENVMEDFGFNFNVVDGFSNGYKFDGAVKVDQNAVGEGGEVLENTDQLDCTYKKGDASISLFADTSTLSEHSGELIGEYKGTPVYYSSYTNKIVPPDYEMTPEDKAAEANGDLVFSWGSDEVNVQEVASASWSYNGINCSILMIDNGINNDEILQMVGEIIDNQN